MSKLNAESLNHRLQSNSSDEDTDENDDLIIFQFESQTICLYYSQFSKYSKHIRDKYIFSDVVGRFPQELRTYQEQYNINLDNILLFFQLLQQNLYINENLVLTYKQFIDLFKLSDCLKIKKLPKQLKKYFKIHNTDVDFIIQIILFEIETGNKSENYNFHISEEMESVLSSKINECFSNENFSKLPIPVIYRIVNKSTKNDISNDNLYDFIIKSLNKFCVLFQFLDLNSLSDSKLENIYDVYSASDDLSKRYFDYLKCNLLLIKTLNEQKKELKRQLNEVQRELNQEKECKIEGEINAQVKNGLLINGEINLISKGAILDTTKSKYIISMSNELVLGAEKYEKGELITSLKQKTIDLFAKPGTYYIRCIVFDGFGKSKELISNAVNTSGSSISFNYEGKPIQIILPEGNYKLEVWGAQGGDSCGSRVESVIPSKGGLGGYSTGIIHLNKSEKIYVFVGGSGKSANSADGSTTEGSFPDGGGTKTGHYSLSYTSVPGTGGGSTSIRISNDSLYSQVIVAGGGGGASGGTHYIDNGGFGGGMNGGNCYNYGKLQNQGGGTQINSTCGLGDGSDGNPGIFGKGAENKYEKNHNSGGGGGGGWYGGGSGGYGGNAHCSSGGGGSGWVFTESNYNSWMSGDSTNAIKFQLNDSFYLLNARTFAGNSQFPNINGNGMETGHAGNGYAKITLE